jgi:outer membrane receptor protein involved in Fe transport
MSPRDALDRLLAHTGLAVVDDPKTGALMVNRPPPAGRPGKPETTLSPDSKSSPAPMISKNPFAALGAVLLAALAPAQTASDPRPAARDESVVALSPFVVRNDQDVGYLAANTLAGSRLNTALKDTPASISVFTSEFMSDLGAFSLADVARYAVNVEFQLDDDRAANPNGNETVQGYASYRVRGLRASAGQNYFRWTLPIETGIVERIEDSRGPNAVLFGIASPGGLLNSATKRAQTGRSFRAASFSAGSHDSWRGTLDLNQRLANGRGAIRLNTVSNQTKSFRHWQFQETTLAHLAGTFRLTERTQLRAEAQHGQIDSNQPRADNLFNAFLLWTDAGRPTNATQVANAAQGTVRLSTNTATPRPTFISNDGTVFAQRGTLSTLAGGAGGSGVVLDRRYTNPSINIGGTAQDRSSRFNAFSAYVEHRLAQTTFLELAFNHQDHVFDRYDPQVDTPQRLRGDPNQLNNDGSRNPFAGRLYLEGGWQRLYSRESTDTGRLMASTERDLRRWGNYRVATLLEYEKTFTGSATYREMWTDAATGLPAFNSQAENTANIAYRRTYPIEGDWATYQLSGPGRGGLFNNVRDPITARTLSSAWFPSSGTSPREIYTTQKAGMIAGQARYFGGRLIFAAGLRRDELDERSIGRRRDARTGEWIVARDPATADPAQRAFTASNVGRNETAGVVWHATKWLSAFYNQANNIALPSRGATRLPDDGTPGNPIPVDPPRGTGRDFGLAFDLFGGALYARATYYTTAGEGQTTTPPSPAVDANVRIMDALRTAGRISQAERDARVLTGTQGRFDHKSEGVELQVTANATRAWRFQANYSYTDAKEENLFPEWLAWHRQNVRFLAGVNTAGVVTSAARTIAEEVNFYLTTNAGLNEYTENDGGTKLGARRHKVNFFTRYSFASGWLRGAYLGGGVNYQSKLFTGLDPADREVWSPSYWRADAVAGYTVRGLRRDRKLSFQLNVYNLFDERDALIVRYSWETGGQRPFRTVPQPPTTWRFTTNLEF